MANGYVRYLLFDFWGYNQTSSFFLERIDHKQDNFLYDISLITKTIDYNAYKYEKNGRFF